MLFRSTIGDHPMYGVYWSFKFCVICAYTCAFVRMCNMLEAFQKRF